jgi:hypothetical protein
MRMYINVLPSTKHRSSTVSCTIFMSVLLEPFLLRCRNRDNYNLCCSMCCLIYVFHDSHVLEINFPYIGDKFHQISRLFFRVSKDVLINISIRNTVLIKMNRIWCMHAFIFDEATESPNESLYPIYGISIQACHLAMFCMIVPWCGSRITSICQC